MKKDISQYVSQINEMTSSLKAEKFWAEMRSTAYLFHKGMYATPSRRKALQDQLQHILGKRITTYPPLFKQLGISEETPYNIKREILTRSFDSPAPDPSEVRFAVFMANKAAQVAKANWCWRITQEAEQKQLEGWYPFFVTLTVDPKKCHGQVHKLKGREVSYNSVQDLWSQGREFRLYIRNLAKTVAQCLGHPPPHKATKEYGYRPESDYVTYAAVIEHGKSQEHHHAHIMLWLKEIPSHWKIDPNQGRITSQRFARECKALRNYWYWCIDEQKPALYFRSKGDIWSRLGHVTPIDGRKTQKNGKQNKGYGKPIKINPIEAVGNYVTKYMQKGTKVWNHRMKCTRNLGLKRLYQVINSLDKQTIKALSWKPPKSNQLHSASLIHSVPQGLLRSIAKRKIFSIQWEDNLLKLETLMKTNYGHYSAMLKSVRDGARPDRMHSLQCYDWVQQFLPEEKEFSEKIFYKSHRLLSDIFPKNIHKVQPVVIPGKEYGFTQCL